MTLTQYANLTQTIGDMRKITREVLLLLLGAVDTFYNTETVGKHRFVEYKDGKFIYEYAAPEDEPCSENTAWHIERCEIGLNEDGAIAVLKFGKYGKISWSEKSRADEWVELLDFADGDLFAESK